MKAVVSCRPDKKFMARFMKIVETLGTTDSDLARVALENGLDKAAQQIANRKRKEAESTLARLKDTRRMSFNAPEFQPFGPQLAAA